MGEIQRFIQYIFDSLKMWVIIQPWEAGIRVRNGKHIKKLSKGIYFKLPYFDSVYVQEIRLRVRELPMQTLTTKDHKTVTLNSSIGYTISDIEKLYETLYRPEMTLQNIAMSAISEVMFKTRSEDLTPEKIEQAVLEKLAADDYGMNYEYFKITNFAIVRTYRLIQDQTWVDSGFSMNEKK